LRTANESSADGWALDPAEGAGAGVIGAACIAGGAGAGGVAPIVETVLGARSGDFSALWAGAGAGGAVGAGGAAEAIWVAADAGAGLAEGGVAAAACGPGAPATEAPLGAAGADRSPAIRGFAPAMRFPLAPRPRAAAGFVAPEMRGFAFIAAAVGGGAGFAAGATGFAGTDVGPDACGAACACTRAGVGLGGVRAGATSGGPLVWAPGCGVAGGVRNSHQPTPPAITIAPIRNGSRLRCRGCVPNGVARSGAAPRRRLASDFFNASRIRDMIWYTSIILYYGTGGGRLRPATTARTAFPGRRCRPA
jgi:hypothetical protein